MNTRTFRGINSMETAPPRREICWYYQSGRCRFGMRCRNLHVRENVQNNSTRNVTSSKKSSNNTSVPNTNSPCASSSFQPETEDVESSSVESLNKECGICFDTVLSKQNKREQLFGILPNCHHCFCFTCIKKWRQSKEFDFDVSKACPECRVPSDYVYPSKKWYEVIGEKQAFVNREKSRLQTIHCKHFAKGSRKCPFGNTCVFLHALPNGVKIDVGPPKPRGRNFELAIMEDLMYYLTDEEDEEDDDYDYFDIEDDDDAFDHLDLNDPSIAIQYYDKGDIEYYMAMDKLMNPGYDDDSSDSD